MSRMGVGIPRTARRAPQSPVPPAPSAAASAPLLGSQRVGINMPTSGSADSATGMPAGSLELRQRLE
jgi:hypothetical protein